MQPNSPPLSSNHSPLSLGLCQLANAIRERRWTAVEVTEASLNEIASLNSRLQAFCTIDSDGAMKQAQSIDRQLGLGEAVGPLAGVPVAIKDLISTKHLRTTYGSLLYANFVPDEDDVVVERLRKAGAVIVGKTNTSEFGYGAVGHNPLFPTTRNPWNTRLTPGGSSAGSACAVVTNMVPLALGSDGGGSVRIPAALSGVFGIKPSWGRVPVYPGCRDDRYPGISSWESLEHIGPLTRHTADAALALEVISGPSTKDRFSIPSDKGAWQIDPPETLQGKRLAVSLDMGHLVVDSEIRAAVELAALKIGTALGRPVESACPEVGKLQSSFETLVAMDTDRVGLKKMAEMQGIKLTGWLADLVARDWSADEFTAALMARKRIQNITSRFMSAYDFLLTPSTAAPAFEIDIDGPQQIDGQDVPPTAWIGFSSLANLTGLPAASVPVGKTKDGRPIGLQIMGRHLDDKGVLTLSALVESLYPRDEWTRRDFDNA